MHGMHRLMVDGITGLKSPRLTGPLSKALWRADVGRRNLVIRKLSLLLSAPADRVGLEAPASLDHDPGGSHAAARAQFGSHGPTDSKRGGSAASRQVPRSVASLRRPPLRVMHARHRVVVHEIDCRVVLSLANACACYTILP